MSEYKKDIKKCADEIIVNVIKDNYVDAEKHTRVAAACNVAGRISQECSNIHEEEIGSRV